MQPATPGMPGWPPGRPAAGGYDPFARGPHAVGVCTLELPDASRGRILPCEVWYPARPQPAAQDGPAAGRGAAALAGQHPLVAYSHHAGGHRRKASFLASHLASHGYVVAAPDHSEVVAAALAPREAESDAERAERIDAIIASRVPDVRLVVDYLLSGAAGIELDPARVGLAGHSLGGWTVLAAPDTEPRAAAVVAMAPGGISRTRPGVLRLSLDFAWGRELPALYLAAEQDVPIPLDGVQELFDRAPAPKRMFVLRRADHQHFVDDVEADHEALRAMALPADSAWLTAEMLPVAELCSAEQAHTFSRGLALAHLDAALRSHQGAAQFLAGDVGAALAARGVEAITGLAAPHGQERIRAEHR